MGETVVSLQKEYEPKPFAIRGGPCQPERESCVTILHMRKRWRERETFIWISVPLLPFYDILVEASIALSVTI